MYKKISKILKTTLDIVFVFVIIFDVIYLTININSIASIQGKMYAAKVWIVIFIFVYFALKVLNKLRIIESTDNQRQEIKYTINFFYTLLAIYVIIDILITILQGVFNISYDNIIMLFVFTPFILIAIFAIYKIAYKIYKGGWDNFFKVKPTNIVSTIFKLIIILIILFVLFYFYVGFLDYVLY